MLLLSTSFCPESAALDSADSSLRPVRVRESSLLSLSTSLSASSIDCCSSFLDSSNDFVSEVPFEEVLFEEAPFDCPDGLLDDCPAAAPSESAFGSCNAVSAFFSWMLFRLAFRESVALSNVLATRLSCVMVASALQPSVSTVFSALVAASANASMMSFTPSAPRISFCSSLPFSEVSSTALRAELNSASDCRHVANAS